MTGPLPTDLRNTLAAVIKKARREGEAGARKALESLAVHHHEPHGSMTLEERALRIRLRAHGRQLGDALDRTRGGQTIEHLVHEVAYEHWHRMLFARFLAENQLLIEPASGVAISMGECEELARESGEDPWALASRYAQRMLPRIFRPDDPVLEVVLAPETRQALERLLESLPAAIFTADDSLGWTYQFWQAERKDEVNKSGVKIGADELPAVTQLFTEHYMVQFLFHNTIGAWRAGKVLAERPELAATATGEVDLRAAVRISAGGGYGFDYLRFVREPRDGDEDGAPSGAWRPAAGAFEGWPRSAAELRVLDPCCGSGHFLVEGFELLVRLRVDEEGLAPEEAIRGVLTDNLFGLEIDPRCTQLAAFNVALAAWRLAGKPIELPALNIACSGLAVGAAKKDWLALAGDDERLRGGMDRLYDLFEKAPELGSLIDPGVLEETLLHVDFRTLQELLSTALGREEAGIDDVERTVAARGMARAAELLAGRYTLVITNVPYLGRGNQSETLGKFCELNYKEAKADLSTVFVSRIMRWLNGCGTMAAVTPQNWLFLTSYRRLREQMLEMRTWNLVARLGSSAFETISGQVVNVTLLSISACKPEANASMAGLDASSGSTASVKAALLRGEIVEQNGPRTSTAPAPRNSDEHTQASADGSVRLTSQSESLQHSGGVVTMQISRGVRLASYATASQGLKTGDDNKWLRCNWEVCPLGDRWRLLQGTPDTTALYAGREHVVDWLEQGSKLARLQGARAWEKDGVAIKLMGSLPATLYTGEAFDGNVSPIVPRMANAESAIWCLCAAGEYATAVRRIDQALKVTNASLVKVPFDLAHWQRVAAERYPNGLPEPQSNDPTQWLFHGHPGHAEPVSAIQVALARMLGYRWPPELDPEMRLAREARVWVDRCRELEGFVDRDGIVCLSALRGETTAADRLRRVLAAAFGSEWSLAKERELVASASGEGATPLSLEDWLRDRFFEQHCRLFHHRPFIWHIWDGRKDGFHAFVSYHRLAGAEGEGRRTLQTLTYSYLGDWIERQKAEQREGKEGSDARLAVAQDLQTQLERILAGEPPYDVFVRWKPLGQQAIGWDPDINDGVRLNIRPFLLAQLHTGGRSGAGILRWKPNIKWDKDRGTEPQSLRPKADFPWFWGCPGKGSMDDRTDFMGGASFDGNRWNDLHYSRAVKDATREPKQ